MTPRRDPLNGAEENHNIYTELNLLNRPALRRAMTQIGVGHLLRSFPIKLTVTRPAQGDPIIKISQVLSALIRPVVILGLMRRVKRAMISLTSMLDNPMMQDTVAHPVSFPQGVFLPYAGARRPLRLAGHGTESPMMLGDRTWRRPVFPTALLTSHHRSTTVRLPSARAGTKTPFAPELAVFRVAARVKKDLPAIFSGLG